METCRERICVWLLDAVFYVCLLGQVQESRFPDLFLFPDPVPLLITESGGLKSPVMTVGLFLLLVLSILKVYFMYIDV